MLQRTIYKIFKIAGIVFLVESCLFLMSCSQDNSEHHQPNILFILLDDLGKEWVGIYGADEIKTPNIDKLGKAGIVFTNAYSMPQCTPSRVTLLTGQYPWRHGWINHYDVPRWGNNARFDPDMNPSFAKMLHEAGYRTCAAGKWQINDFRLEPHAMSNAGFEKYCMWTGGEGGNLDVSRNRYWDPYIHTENGSRVYKGQFGEDVFSDYIIDFMRQFRNDPFLVYYAMCLPHMPLTTTPIEPDIPKEEQFKAMVRYTDHILKKLLNALEELDLRKETIVVWSTDNGTAKDIIGSRNGMPVLGGKSYLSENGVNAPFIISAPGIVAQGIFCDALVDFTDLLPTFCDLAGIEKDKKYTYDGISFAPILTGRSRKSERDWIMALGSHPAKISNGRIRNAFDYRDRVIRNKQFKAYVDTNAIIYEIVDVQNDFYEQNNLIGSSDQEVVKVTMEFQEIIDSLPRMDNNPKYEKSKTSIYNISVDKLEQKCESYRRYPNKTPPVVGTTLIKFQDTP